MRALGGAMLYAPCSFPVHAAACCDELQPTPTPLETGTWFRVELVRMSLHPAQLR